MFSFLSEKFSGVLGWLKGKSRLTEKDVSQALEKVHDALLEADVPYDVVISFLEEVKKDVVGVDLGKQVSPGDFLIKIVHDKLVAFLSGDGTGQVTTYIIPSVIMVMGLQGSGKTTTLAKLAGWIKIQAQKRGKKRRILAASIDYYRPAAIEQLKILAEQADISFYRPETNDPVQAARMIYDYFKQESFEHLLLDTAGRLQIDQALMTELATVESILKPRYKYLVLDSMTGQQSLSVAQTFAQQIGFDGAILTKMDSDTRAGAAFAFRYVVKKPIVYVGTGEKIDDIEQFHVKRMAGRILGMGDLESLLERAEQKIDQKQQETMTRRMMSGNFTLKDFAEQMSTFSQLGSLQKIMHYMPGSHKVSPQMLEQGQVQMKKFRAIIDSMTLKEQLCPQILDGSRRSRIAKGSGTSVQGVNQLLEKFEQSKQFVKMFKKSRSSNRF